MTLEQIANLFALVVVNVCGYAALAPRLKRVEDKLDTKVDKFSCVELHKAVDKRVGKLEDSAA